MKRLNTETWLATVPEQHKIKHDYSKLVYLDSKNKVEIGCVKHGTFFWQSPNSHSGGNGCPTCGKENAADTQRLTTQEFINRSLATKPHYDHSLVKYKNKDTKVDIICNVEDHGVFSMSPTNRMKGKQCPKCAQLVRNLKQTKTQEEFINECESLSNDNYTFPDTVYQGDKVKVTIHCKHHGDFSAIPSNFLQGQGCPKCAETGFRKNKAGYLYILSDNNTTKVGITNRKPEIRVKEVIRTGGPKLDIIAAFYFDDGQLVWNLEQACHTYLKQNYKQVDAIYNGSTECFLNVDLPALLSFVTPLATEKPLATPEVAQAAQI
jgi:hypothetical protein